MNAMLMVAIFMGHSISNGDVNVEVLKTVSPRECQIDCFALMSSKLHLPFELFKIHSSEHKEIACTWIYLLIPLHNRFVVCNCFVLIIRRILRHII